MKDDDLLTISAIAQEFARDRRTVARRLIGVQPVKIQTKGERLFRYWKRSDVEPAMRKRSTADEARYQLERLHKARADKLELDREIRAGRLISLDTMCDELGRRCEGARAKFLSAPSRYAPQLAHINATMIGAERERAFAGLLREIITEAMDDLSSPLSFQPLDG